MSDIIRPPAPTGILEESPGVKSSKRYFGAALIGTGGLLLVGIGVAAIFREVRDPSTALEAGKALLVTGAGLLGVGVLEGVGHSIGSSASRRPYRDDGGSQ